MVAYAIPFAMCAVNDNFAHEGPPRLAVHKERPDFPPLRLERWAVRLLRRT